MDGYVWKIGVYFFHSIGSVITALSDPKEKHENLDEDEIITRKVKLNAIDLDHGISKIRGIRPL